MLFSGIKNFRELPYLKEEHAIGILSIGVVGLIVATWDILRTLDPWAEIFFGQRKTDLSYFVAVLILLIVTGIIAWKQLSYYYAEHGTGKQGIFKYKIKQVNPLEMTLDILLAMIGALLFFFTALPTLWFLLLSIYSVLVVSRCFFTLLRKQFAEYLRKRNKEIPSWYESSLNREHNRLTVKFVLGGWICSHSFVGIYSFLMFQVFYFIIEPLYVPYRLAAFLIAIVGIIILYLGLAKRSYSWGKKICALMNLE